ncbi:MAG: TIGR03067 domain-containing protein [Gemmataceae bacterium]|nr:TIGR03067 domain-containing protein [Gemmata sp.]MDW8196866.1 TIGR03067 domain-containing protein [Gemmataceae bacterium]
MIRMAVRGFLLLVVAALTVSGGADEKANQTDKIDKADKTAKGLKELEGTYKLIHAERDGKVAEKALLETVTIVIHGDEFTLSFSPDDKKVAKIKVTPDDKLSTIDVTPQDGPEKGKTFPGIYKIEGGILTLAFSEKGERPKEFKSDNEVTVLQLKKAEK